MAEARRGRLGFEDTLTFTNSLCLAYTLCSGILRAWIRRNTYGVDDAVIVVATCAMFSQFASVYVALDHGAGKPWQYIDTGHDVGAFIQASLASVVTFTLALYLSKASVVSFLLRLTKHGRQIWVHRICLAIFTVVGLASILVVTVSWPASSGHYWLSLSDSVAVCSVQSTRWTILTALDLLSELSLLILPLNIVWNLQMPTQRKLVILGAFWLRLPLLALAIARLVYTRRLCNNGIDIGLDSALVTIWMLVESTYALLVSQFLALRAFTLSFNSGFGFGFTVNAGPESYSMQRTRGNKVGSGGGSGGGSRVVALNAYGAGSKAGMRDWRDGGDASSGGTNTMSIMRETEYSVQYLDSTDEMPILREARDGRSGVEGFR